MKQFTLIFLLFSLNNFAQNYEVVYNLEQVAKNISLTTNIKTYLHGNQTNSIYVEDFRNSFQESANSFMNIPTESNPTYFKDLQTNVVIYNDHIRFKFFDIIDSIPKFDWNIKTYTKEILGYRCQKATLNFRGRDFIVFFTPDIPASDGPRKFTGLPGLILEITSDDSVGSFHYIAESIKLSQDKVDVKNPYINKETVTYNEYLKKYQIKYDESLAKIINEKGERRPMSKGFMEVLIK